MDQIFAKKRNAVKASIDKNQIKDTGLVVVLVFLIITVYTRNWKVAFVAIGFLLIDMIVPIAFMPLARVWFGLSKLIGTVMSKVILSVLFFALVTPVGILRRMFGADRLMLKQWKKDNTSVFKVRDHLYQADEIERPF